MKAITNKNAWLQDKEHQFIPANEEVEILDNRELENGCIVVRHNGINCILKKEDLEVVE